MTLVLRLDYIAISINATQINAITFQGQAADPWARLVEGPDLLFSLKRSRAARHAL